MKEYKPLQIEIQPKVCPHCLSILNVFLQVCPNCNYRFKGLSCEYQINKGGR